VFKEEALDRINAELHKRWPPSRHGSISVELLERDYFFDYRIHNAGNQLSSVDQVVRSVLGKSAGSLLM
jgi:hypothetical protein